MQNNQKGSTTLTLIIMALLIIIAGAYFYTKYSSKSESEKVSETNQIQNKKILKVEDIVGVWQRSSVMAAGWNERYQFFVSGKYNHRPSQMVCDSSDRGDSGYWKINNDNSIELNIVQKIFVDEKQIIPDDFGGCGTSNTINKVSLDKIVIVDVCTGAKSNPESLTCMTLDGVEYYRISKDPKNDMDSELDNEPNF